MARKVNKRIAKNAAALYLRMIISMLVGLYTSRVILQALGVEDYGIYNVVGGFVSMFSLISSSINVAVGRFLTYELGSGDINRLSTVFSTSFFVMLGLSVIIIILTETVGIWYMYNKLVIPYERFYTALWCFQLSVVSFVISLIASPYSSAIISHEDMGIYAYLSILDVLFKLCICYIVIASPIDHLLCYAVLLFIVGGISQSINIIYCRRKYKECILHLSFDRQLFLKMFAFSGWNFIGSSAAILRLQGASLLLNAFGGPVVNTANGIANSVSNILSGFIGNFTQAFNPQIIKQYASRDYESLMKLIIFGSKYSYYLMFLLSLPILFNTEFILNLWLGTVPQYTVTFTRWILIMLLIDSMTRPIITLKLANSNIRNYQVIVGGTILLMLPISYLGLKYGMPVTFVAVVNTLISFLVLFVRIYMVRGDFAGWSSALFLKKVVMNIFFVSAVSCIFPFMSHYWIDEGWINFAVTTLLSVICSCLCIFFIGCSVEERLVVVNFARKTIFLIKKQVRL